MDISTAKMQATVLRRVADRLHKYGDSLQDGHILDFADHLRTETSYLMDALDMPTEER